MRFSRVGVLSCAVAWTLWPVTGAAQAQDQAALELAREAIEIDYLTTSFAQAAQKLEQALKLCQGEACSVAVKAQLYRDLGIVLIAQKDPERGKQQFVQALQTDPKIGLNEALATPEMRKLFDEARVIAGAPEPEPTPEPEPKPEAEAEPPPAPAPETAVPAEKADCPPNFPGCDAPQDKGETLQPGAQNWLSLGVQLDFLILSATAGVCSGDTGYDCFFDSETYYEEIPSDRGLGQDGNEVSNGLARGTLRLLAGYDRFFGENFGVGARVGFAFFGGPQAPEGRAFLPIHAEARLTYVFGEQPLARAGLRGFVHVGGGLAQVDATVPVTVYLTDADLDADRRTSLDAWKKSGLGFAALGGGVMYALTPKTGPYFDVRLMQLFGLSGTALSPQLGWQLGI